MVYAFPGITADVVVTHQSALLLSVGLFTSVKIRHSRLFFFVRLLSAVGFFGPSDSHSHFPPTLYDYASRQRFFLR